MRTGDSGVQRSWVWVCLAVGVVMMAVGSIPVSGHCPGLVGNRELYRKVSWVCEDCANLFRDNSIEVNCSRNCFSTDDFTTCVLATERHHEHEQLARWVSILYSGRRR